MWMMMEANEDYYTPMSYIKRTKTQRSGGKVTPLPSTTYTGMVGVFVPDGAKRIRDENGNWVDGIGEVSISQNYFSGYAITPSLDDVITIKGNNYRVVKVSDYTMMMHGGIYHLLIKRDEHAI